MSDIETLIAREIGRYLAQVQILGEVHGYSGHEAMRAGARLLRSRRGETSLPDLVDCKGNQVWPPRHTKTARALTCICGADVQVKDLLQYSDTAMACCSADCARRLRAFRCGECKGQINRHDFHAGCVCTTCRRAHVVG